MAASIRKKVIAEIAKQRGVSRAVASHIYHSLSIEKKRQMCAAMQRRADPLPTVGGMEE